MPRIAYIVLCHNEPETIISQAQQLTAHGDYVSIHFDARSSDADFKKLVDELSDNPNVTFATKRIKCGWGEWSLVQATLYAIEAAAEEFPRASYFYMMSGACSPIKSARFMHEFLEANDVDFIESFDFFDSNWIKTGIKEERLIYRHFFNERTQSRLFYWSFHLQQKLGLKREIPADIQVQIGSQWWCLRRRTIEAILEFVKERPDVVKFFRTTWIPDETFFQTLVRHLIPGNEIRTRTLTFLMFTDYGLPVVFYNDHYDMLLAQSHLFARKISSDADDLRARLGELYSDNEREFQITDGGANLFQFLTTRGRVGRRFGARFWETEATLGPDRELLIIVCKKWHVAKRLLETARQKIDTPMLEYVFNEIDSGVPDLGGIERSLGKRARHRRALMRTLYDYFDTNRLTLCIDPGNFEILQDFIQDRANTRVLEIQCEFSDDYVKGHAQRIGLASDATPQNVLERLLPTVSSELYYEREQIREASSDQHWIIAETFPDEYNAAQLSSFFELSYDDALELARTPYLFAD